MTEYVIWAPPHTHASGGVRALYQLCAMLRAEGERASIQLTDQGVAYHGTFIASPYDAPPAPRGRRDDVIVVYPETIVDNPAGAERYVRWLLGPAVRDGLCFQWLPSMGDGPVLHVPIVEPDIFYPRTGPRSGTAVWVGKATGEHRERWLPVDAVEIMRDTPPTRRELADLLGSVERLVSLDAFCCMNLEAAMCGTPVRVHTDKLGRYPTLRDQDDYVSSAGIAYDDDPWEIATATVSHAYDRYLAAEPLKVESVRRFIRMTQEH